MAHIMGTSASETLTGGDGDDYIVGNGGNDTLIGAGGADQLFGYTGADLLDGGDGADILSGDLGDDRLLGGAGSDRLNGGGGGDMLDGGDGDDVLTLDYDAGYGPPGANNIDYLTGGAGADRFVTRHGSIASSLDHITDFSALQGDRIDLVATDDTSRSTPVVWSGAITRPDFTVAVGQSLDPGMGTGFAQVWTWSNATTTYLILDADDNRRIDAFDFVLAFDGAVPLDVASFVAGTFNTNVGTPGADVWSGGTAGEVYYSGAGADTLSGLGGDDELHGGDGADAIDGGEGADILIGEFGDDVLHGGLGADMLFAGGRYNGQNDSQGSVNVLYGDDGDDFLGGSTGVDTLYGGAGDDILSGGVGDKLYGGDGADQMRITAEVTGAAAIGTLDGGAGDDLIYLEAPQVAAGGAGADRFSLRFVPNGFTPPNPAGHATITDFNAGDGDRLDFSQSYSYQAVVWRGAIDNPAFSLAAGDTFSSDDYGSGFSQIWTWTQGGDTYLIIDTNNDGVLQYGVPKPDFVLKFNSPIGLDTGAFQPNFLFTGVNGTSAADTFNGGADGDTYYGINGDDQLHGGGGQDALYGNNGVDKLWGDDGDDKLNGGAGDDVLEGGDGGDLLTGGAGSDLMYGGAGNDQLSAGGGGVGELDATGATNLLYGEAGDDILVGGGSLHDRFYGGDGKDTIVGSGELYGEAGDDRMRGVGASVIDGGAGDDSLQGSDYVDVMFGGAGKDDVYGAWGADILHVDLGDSYVNGGDGADQIFIGGLAVGETRNLTTVQGDEGADIFTIEVDLGGDALTVSGGSNYWSGPDADALDLRAASGAVQVDLSRTDAQQTGMGLLSLWGIEDVYAGAFGSTLIGDGGSNRLFGGAGGDSLDGGRGLDLLTGGAGADTLTGGDGNDRFEGLLADLAGDTIVDLSAGDQIRITDTNISTFTMSRDGSTVTLSGGVTFTLQNDPKGTLVASADPGGGVRIKLQLPETAAKDINGDGHSDFIWRHTSGYTTAWMVGEGGGPDIGFKANTFGAEVSRDWKLETTLDFNGDGKVDLLWRHDAGVFTIWGGAGEGFVSNIYVNGEVGTDWKIETVGDFDGDGRSDLIWRHASGTYTAWRSTGTDFERNFMVDSMEPNFKVAAVGDFDADGVEDILWRDTTPGSATAGEAMVTTSLGDIFAPASQQVTSVDLDWTLVGHGDFNGDNKEDILWRNATGMFTEWQSTGSGFVANVYANATVDPVWKLADIADYNGDGKDDLMWRHTGGAFTIWQSTGDSFIENVVVNGSVSADWDLMV